MLTDPARAARSRAEFDRLVGLWDAAGGSATGLALACTGSLARGELGPGSDLDLVVLHDPRHPAELVTEVAQALWYPLWDSGRPLDHAVRTPEECRQVARDDLTVAVALLDLRHVAGDAALVEWVRRSLAEDWRAEARRRLPELVDAVAGRHARFGDLPQLLEPDLKESRGGLRDMGVLRALTASWLADRPHGTVDTAYTVLLDARDALQATSGRGRNLLTLGDQDAVSRALGLPDADVLHQRLGGAARHVATALDSTLRRAGQSQRARLPRRGPRRARMTSLAEGIHAHDGEVVLRSMPAEGQRADSLLALRAGAVAARSGLTLAPATTLALARLPPVAQPWSDEARGLLLDLLGGRALVPTWNALDLAGVVQDWMPEWAGIRDRPQRNALHRHTVDRHCLETVVVAQGLPTDRPDLLLVAALLHDIGKTGGGDHSVTGAALVPRILDRWGFAPDDTALVTTVVREHLTLMRLATGRDPDAPATAAELAERLGGSVTALELLGAVSEADARATGPRTWSPLRAGLAQQLLVRTRAQLAG